MTRTNLLFLLSDEHRRDALGCYGHPFVKTPNLDRLAARSTRFTQAYCNSPLCVPSRASLATGRYVHETRCWDNGHPFEGQLPSWAERLRDQGHRTVAVGKLHYRRSEDANGFSEEIIPLHLIDGTGDLIGLLRKEGAHYGATERYAKDAGPGESDYTDYDRRIAAAAVDWLRSEAPRHRDKPWALFVSFVSPHFPLTAPREFYDLYAAVRMPRPRAYGDDERHRHPFLEGLTRAWNYDDYFDEERLQVARSAYFGLCSFLDHNIGTILAALEDAGLMDDTRVLYSSDHGEMLGDQGIWSTSVMYEASAGVPLLLAGPGGAEEPGDRHHHLPRRCLPDGHRMHRRRAEPRGRGAPRTLTHPHREGCQARAHGAHRVPCRRVDHRLLHGSRRPMEVRALRRAAAAALRYGGGS